MNRSLFEVPLIMRAPPGAPAPTSTLMTAALAGMLSVGLSGCGDEETSCPVVDAGEDITPWRDSGHEEDAGDDEQDAGAEDDEKDGSAERDAASADAGAGDAAVGPEILSEEEVDIPFAKLVSMCDDRGGYVQVHSGCAGSNDCAGFSYGDWDPDILTEHTCAHANGCSGLSCVVLPEDSGKTAEEILFHPDPLPANGPQPCWYCHAESQHQEDGSYDIDKTIFKVWVPPGSTRNETNWLDLSAAHQEAIVAFGASGKQFYERDGVVVVDRSMQPYHKLYSRAEIERVVEHLRTLTPLIKVMEPRPHPSTTP